VEVPINDKDTRFVAQAIRRERLFLVLMAVGLVVGVGLLAWSAGAAVQGESWSVRFVLAILVLLNARGNLRQAKYARILRELV
jgi:hypothetical protein